jgi:hypothetical protein
MAAPGGDDGIADAVARKVCEDSVDAVDVVPQRGLSCVEAEYTGFDQDALPAVLAQIITDLADDLDLPPPEIPSEDKLSDLGDPPSAMRAFLSPLWAGDLKLVVFDGGEDDSEEHGYCAVLVPTSFDVQSRLDAAGLFDAGLDDRDGLMPPIH